MQGGFRRSEQGSDQVVRTQEIHIVSSVSYTHLTLPTNREV